MAFYIATVYFRWLHLCVWNWAKAQIYFVLLHTSDC